MQRSVLAAVFISALICVTALPGPTARAQTPALDTLVPQTTKALFCVPNATKLKAQFQKTQFNAMLKDPVLAPFRNDLKKQLEGKFDNNAGQLGLTIQDFRAVASGEVCSAAIQPSNDKTHGVMVLADVTGNVPAATALVKKAVAAMVAKGGVAKTYTIGGEPFSGVNVKAFANVGNGFVFLAVVNNILIGSDHYGETSRLMERISGKAGADNDSLSNDANYQLCMARIGKFHNGETPQMRWFVDPFGYMEVNRASKLVRRGRGPDMLMVAQKVGFGAITAFAGQVHFATADHEMLFHNFLYVKDGVANLEQAAAMLKMPPLVDIKPQDWVPNSSDSYTTLGVDAKTAFEAAKPLVNELAGAPVLKTCLPR